MSTINASRMQKLVKKLMIVSQNINDSNFICKKEQNTYTHTNENYV